MPSSAATPPGTTRQGVVAPAGRGRGCRLIPLGLPPTTPVSAQGNLHSWLPAGRERRRTNELWGSRAQLPAAAPRPTAPPLHRSSSLATARHRPPWAAPGRRRARLDLVRRVNDSGPDAPAPLPRAPAVAAGGRLCLNTAPRDIPPAALLSPATGSASCRPPADGFFRQTGRVGRQLGRFLRTNCSALSPALGRVGADGEWPSGRADG